VKISDLATLFIPISFLIISLSGCQSIGGLGSGKPPLLETQRIESAEAQYRRGLQYSSGLRVKQDFEKAAEWFRLAAEKGHTGAQYMLGDAYYYGRGVAKKQKEGVKWLSKAAANNHARAQYRLGDAFINGRGVELDLAWGARWFGKAAMQGHKEAQFSLAVSFATGLGLQVDNIEAWKWLTLASNAGNKKADEVRAKIGEKMNAEEISKAQKLSSSWKKSASKIYADRPTVRYVQYVLSIMGYRLGKVDGIMGAKTKRAVEDYRRKSGLPSVGGITPEMVKRLRADPASRPKPKPAS